MFGRYVDVIVNGKSARVWVFCKPTTSTDILQRKARDILLGKRRAKINTTELVVGEPFSVFRYKFEEEVPFEQLERFKGHRRLRVFYHKGTACVECGRVGTRLIRGSENRTGAVKWCVYTDDLIPLTVDHIIPVSRGGTRALENLQPMCQPCNSAKGNGCIKCGGKGGSMCPRHQEVKE